MSDKAKSSVLPSAVEVPFSKIGMALAGSGEARPGPRAHTNTLVVVAPSERLAEAAEALQSMSAGTGLRAILLSTGSQPEPVPRVAGNTVVIEGIKPEHVNNAVAAFRLSSLPTLVWWRGGEVESLDGLATLADRVLLDAEDPTRAWARAAALSEKTAICDLRWTRLTRWRALMAHFFDIPEVRAIADGFTRLELAGGDTYALRLFAGWLVSSLPSGARLDVTVQPHGTTAPLERVRLANGTQELLLQLLPTGTCVETAARVEGHAGVSRIVPLGDQRLAALVCEELRIRSRDLAFERALRAAEGAA